MVWHTASLIPYLHLSHFHIGHHLFYESNLSPSPYIYILGTQGNKKPNEHLVTVKSRCLEAFMLTFNHADKWDKERECHSESMLCATAKWKMHLLKANSYHLWKAIRAPSPIRERKKKSIVIHLLVRGIDFPDKVCNIPRVCLNHFLAKWHNSNSLRLYS